MQGLPTDDLSIQNGIMVNNAARYPVLVDPQGQARTWILNKEQCNELRVTQLNDRMFRCATADSYTIPSVQVCRTTLPQHLAGVVIS